MALDVHDEAFESDFVLATPHEETDERVFLCMENRFAQLPSPLDVEGSTISQFVDVGQFVVFSGHVSQPSEDETRRWQELRPALTATTKCRRT